MKNLNYEFASDCSFDNMLLMFLFNVILVIFSNSWFELLFDLRV